MPMDDPLRAEYKRTFRRCRRLKELADEKSPRPISDDYVRLAMNVAELSQLKTTSKNHPSRIHGFKARSVFVKWLDYWRPWMMNFRDTDHMLLNRMRQIIALWKGDGNSKMTSAKMAFENSLGRFHHYKPRSTTSEDGVRKIRLQRPPWQATKKERKLVDECLPIYVRLPNSFKNGKIGRAHV